MSAATESNVQGVSAAFLAELRAKVTQFDDAKSLTLAQAVTDIIVPDTILSKKAYSSISEQGGNLIGIPNVLVLAPSNCGIIEILDILIAFSRDKTQNDTIYFLFEEICFTQHHGSKFDSLSVLEKHMNRLFISSLSQAVAIVGNWPEPQLSRNTYELFLLYKCVQNNIPVEFRLSQESNVKLRADLLDKFDETFSFLEGTNLEKSEMQDETKRRVLMDLVSRSGGVFEVNRCVKVLMVTWMFSLGQDAERVLLEIIYGSVNKAPVSQTRNESSIDKLLKPDLKERKKQSDVDHKNDVQDSEVIEGQKETESSKDNDEEIVAQDEKSATEKEEEKIDDNQCDKEDSASTPEKDETEKLTVQTEHAGSEQEAIDSPVDDSNSSAERAEVEVKPDKLLDEAEMQNTSETGDASNKEYIESETQGEQDEENQEQVSEDDNVDKEDIERQAAQVKVKRKSVTFNEVVDVKEVIMRKRCPSEIETGQSGQVDQEKVLRTKIELKKTSNHGGEIPLLPKSHYEGPLNDEGIDVVFGDMTLDSDENGNSGEILDSEEGNANEVNEITTVELSPGEFDQKEAVEEQSTQQENEIESDVGSNQSDNEIQLAADSPFNSSETAVSSSPENPSGQDEKEWESPQARESEEKELPSSAELEINPEIDGDESQSSQEEANVDNTEQDLPEGNETEVANESSEESEDPITLNITTIYNLTQLQQLQENVANVMSLQTGYSGSAIQYYFKAIENQTKVFGFQNEKVALSQFKVGEVLEREERVQSCLEYYEKALRTLKGLEENQENTEMIYKTSLRIAEIQFSSGHLQVALSFYLEALSAMERLHSASEPSLIDLHQKIGNLYLGEKDFEKALSYLEIADKKSKEQKETPAGGHDFLTDQAENNLKMARIYFQAKKYETAVEKLRRSWEMMGRVKDVPMDEQTEVLDMIGSSYFYLSQYEKAVEYFELLLPRLVSTDKHSSEVSLTYCKIGRCCLSLKQFDKALDMFRKDLEIQKKIHGEDSEFVGRAYANLGEIYLQNGEASKTLEYWKQAYWILESKLGESNQETTLVRSYLEKLVWLTA